MLAETIFGAASNYTQLTVKFNSGSNASITAFAGFTGQRETYAMHVDDVSQPKGQKRRPLV